MRDGCAVQYLPRATCGDADQVEEPFWRLGRIWPLRLAALIAVFLVGVVDLIVRASGHHLTVGAYSSVPFVAVLTVASGWAPQATVKRRWWTRALDRA